MTPGPTSDARSRLRVRFVAIYFCLYLFPFPVSVFMPAIEFRVWRPLTEAVGAALGGVLGVAAPRPAYVGDAAVHQLYLVVAVAVALAASAAWHAIDNDARRVATLDRWLRLYLRLALGFTLINYGAIKVIPSQFPALGLDTLYQPIGDASPMGLLWAFMGASYPYVLFTGLVEIVAGALVMLPATASAGALLALAALTQIIALNLGYDVPQKEFAIHLWLMAAYLLAPAAPRVVAALAGRAVPPAASDTGAGPSLQRAITRASAICLVGVLAFAFFNASRNQRSTGATAPRSPLSGVWQVEALNGDPQPWRQMIFDGPEWVGLALADTSYVRVRARFEQDGRFLKLLLEDGSNEAAEVAALRIDRIGDDEVVMEGTSFSRPVHARLRRQRPRPFELSRRPFQWTREADLIR